MLHGVPSKHHAMKTHGGVKVQLHAFISLALDRGEWSASHPGRFTPRERAPGTHLLGWVGPRAGLDLVERRKIILASSGTRTPDHAAHQTEMECHF